MALFRGVQVDSQAGQLDQTAWGSNRKPSNSTPAMVGGESTCPKTKFRGSVSRSSHEKPNPTSPIEIHHSQMQIHWYLARSRRDPSRSNQFSLSVLLLDFDQNRHYPANLKPNQIVFSDGWRRVRFPVTQSGRVGSKLGTNPNQADKWIGLALSCMARKPLSANLECSHLIWLRNWRIGDCKSTTSQILLACAFSLLHLSSTHAS